MEPSPAVLQPVDQATTQPVPNLAEVGNIGQPESTEKQMLDDKAIHGVPGTEPQALNDSIESSSSNGVPKEANGSGGIASKSVETSTTQEDHKESTDSANGVKEDQKDADSPSNSKVAEDSSLKEEVNGNQSVIDPALGFDDQTDNDKTGNKRKSGVADSDTSKKRKQSVLNFSKLEGHTSLSLSTDGHRNGDSSGLKDEPNADGDDSTKSENGEEFVVTLAYKKSPETKKRRTKKHKNEAPPEKLRNFERAAKKPLQKSKPLLLPLQKVKKSSARAKHDPSSTTIVRENNRNARPLPGPLVPLLYNLYDGNTMKSDNNKDIASEKLAFGFSVKHNPNLYDIMYILLFLSKFDPVVQAGPLGPDDFEKGLDLESTLIKPVISNAMEVFFRRLLVLLLNRKKAIPKEGQRPAIQELQSKYASFGLPEEWRDDSLIHEVDSFPCNPLDDVVDPSKPPVPPEDLLEYEGPKELSNPFHSKEFEDLGLAGIESPRQRVILLRTMVVWCLSVSTRVKTYLTTVVSKQEVPGERDNIYVARSVLKGFSHALESKKEHEVKVARKTKPTTKGGIQDFDLRLAYMDPTSDPMKHPLFLRLNEYVIGDIGFHVGRFYLVRTADASAGGLGSLEKMKNAQNLGPGDRKMATNFRLYVEDVYSLLEDCLRVDGVEFDSNGEEVIHDLKYDDTKYWYTVASNYDELQAFLDLVEKKLGSKGKPNDIPTGSDAYRPLLHLYQYLCHVVPIIGDLEGMYVGGSNSQRAARKKAVDYSAASAWDEEEFSEKRADDDYYEDGEEEEEEEEEEEAEFLD